MTLGTTIWVKNLYKKIFEPKFNVHEYKPILPDILFNYGFADPNVEHMEILIELSDQAGIEVQPLLLYKNNVKENHSEFSGLRTVNSTNCNFILSDSYVRFQTT